MNVAIEMHDSEVLSIETDEAGGGSILLDAYVHRTDGGPGISPGEGGIQRIRLKMERMFVEGRVGKLPAYIYEGSLAVDDYVQDNMVLFPAIHPEAFRLKMVLSDDARLLTISGKNLLIEVEGEFRFVETVDFARS